MSTHTNHNDLKSNFEDLFKPRSDEKEIEHDSFMLMAGFLSEIEAIQEQQDISRKELAEKIKISPSYLTQVFRSKKPLNFMTLAKIKRALNIRFEVKAKPLRKLNSYIKSSTEFHQFGIQDFAKISLEESKNDSTSAKECVFHLNSIETYSNPQKVG